MASSTADMTPGQAQAALRTLLVGPAIRPPAGVIPNFHDPPNLDVFVTLTIILCVIFGTLAVLLRMYTKVYILRALAWEDCRSPFNSFYQIAAIETLTFSRYHCVSMGNMVFQRRLAFY